MQNSWSSSFWIKYNFALPFHDYLYFYQTRVYSLNIRYRQTICKFLYLYRINYTNLEKFLSCKKPFCKMKKKKRKEKVESNIFSRMRYISSQLCSRITVFDDCFSEDLHLDRLILFVRKVCLYKVTATMVLHRSLFIMLCHNQNATNSIKCTGWIMCTHLESS